MATLLFYGASQPLCYDAVSLPHPENGDTSPTILGGVIKWPGLGLGRSQRHRCKGNDVTLKTIYFVVRCSSAWRNASRVLPLPSGSLLDCGFDSQMGRAQDILFFFFPRRFFCPEAWRRSMRGRTNLPCLASIKFQARNAFPTRPT